MGKRKVFFFVILAMAPLLFFFQNCGKVAFVGSSSDGSINTGNAIKLNSFSVLDFLSVGGRTEIAVNKSADANNEYVLNLFSGSAGIPGYGGSALGDGGDPIDLDAGCRNQLTLNSTQVLQLQTLLQMAEICVATRDPGVQGLCQGNLSIQAVDFDIDSTRNHILLQDSCSQDSYNIFCENSEVNTSLFAYVRELIQLSGATQECTDAYLSAMPSSM